MSSLAWSNLCFDLSKCQMFIHQMSAPNGVDYILTLTPHYSLFVLFVLQVWRSPGIPRSFSFSNLFHSFIIIHICCEDVFVNQIVRIRLHLYVKKWSCMCGLIQIFEVVKYITCVFVLILFEMSYSQSFEFIYLCFCNMYIVCELRMEKL